MAESGANDVFVVVMMFGVLPLFFAVAAFLVFRYLRAVFKLVEGLRERDPELWKRLGEPQKISQRTGATSGPIDFVSPALPTVVWLLSGAPGLKDLELRKLAVEGRVYLILGFTAFLLTVLVLLGFFAVVMK